MKIEFENTLRIRESSITAFEEMIKEYFDEDGLYLRVGDDANAKDIPIQFVNDGYKTQFFLVGNEFGYLAVIRGSEEDCLNWYAEYSGPEEYEDEEEFNLGYMNDGGTWISEVTLGYMHMREIQWDELNFVIKRK